MKTIRISRRRWGRGGEGGVLHDPATGKQCCLGFACRAFGVPVTAIKGVGYPCDLNVRYRPKLPAWLLHRALTQGVIQAAGTNDDSALSDAERERTIRAIFARHRLRAVFTR